jgi:hypothetical protein
MFFPSVAHETLDKKCHVSHFSTSAKKNGSPCASLVKLEGNPITRPCLFQAPYSKRSIKTEELAKLNGSTLASGVF